MCVSKVHPQGGAFHLLQEHDCRLVIKVKLTNLEDRTMYHFVAWDGNEIYNQPFNSKVNKSDDRTNTAMSKMVFTKLYPSSEFVNW